MLMHNLLCNRKDITTMVIEIITTTTTIITAIVTTMDMVTTMGTIIHFCMGRIIIGITMGSTDM